MLGLSVRVRVRSITSFRKFTHPTQLAVFVLGLEVIKDRFGVGVGVRGEGEGGATNHGSELWFLNVWLA